MVLQSKNLEPLEEVRRGSAIAEAFVEAVRAGPMERARGFDARAGGVPSGPLCRFHKHLADAVSTVGLLDNQGCDPAPGAMVVCDWHEEVRCGSDERPAVLGDEHIAPRISEHALEPTTECMRCLRMAQLVEQASELIGIVEPSRANGHCSHVCSRTRWISFEDMPSAVSN
jgi:hypothetical protein